MTDDEKMQIFCSLEVTRDDETQYVVAFLDAEKPGEIFVCTVDDNYYPDERFPVQSITGAAGIKFRNGDDTYPWEKLMAEAADKLRVRANG